MKRRANLEGQSQENRFEKERFPSPDAATLLLKFVANPLVEATCRMDRSSLLTDCSGDRVLAQNMADLAETAEQAMQYLAGAGYFFSEGTRPYS
jgi:hypothetical protein